MARVMMARFDKHMFLARPPTRQKIARGGTRTAVSGASSVAFEARVAAVTATLAFLP